MLTVTLPQVLVSFVIFISIVTLTALARYAYLRFWKGERDGGFSDL